MALRQMQVPQGFEASRATVLASALSGEDG